MPIKTKPLPSQEELQRLLRYEPETGKLYWRKRPLSDFADERGAKSWNGRCAGKEAFNVISRRASGRHRRKGSIHGKQYLAARVIWKLVHDEEPPEIDHINGDTLDERLANLRAADRLTNAQNMPLSSRNKSGVLGVFWHKADRLWAAAICFNGQTTQLGKFKSFDDALAARLAAESEVEFHPNHGRE